MAMMLFLHPPPLSQSQCRSFSPSFFSHHGEISSSLKPSGAENWVSRFRSKSLSLVFSGALALSLSRLAIKDFWQVDDNTIVFVADPTFGNILNFNVGAPVDLDVPRSFWNRLAGKYGNMFYWKDKGEDASIEAGVMAISSCLREPIGPNNCAEIK